jgi:hypothetical protein
MGMESQNKVVDDNKENYEVEGELDLEGELISALEELRKYKRKSKSLKEQLLEYEGKKNQEKMKFQKPSRNQNKSLLT